MLKLVAIPHRKLASSPVAERLRHNLLLEQLSDEDFEFVRPLLKERRYKEGDIIVNVKHDSSGLFLLVEGRVKISRQTKSGRELVTAVLHVGDFFGELELIDGRPRTSTVVALESCAVYEMQREPFERLLATNLPFTKRLLEVLSVRLRALNHQFALEIDTNTDLTLAELEKLQRLIEAAKTVNSTLDLDKLLTIILDTALEVVHCDRGTIYLVDEKRRELKSKVLKGMEIIEIRLPIGKGIAGYVAATGDVLNIDDAYLDPRFHPEIDSRSGYRTANILCVPMKNKGGTIIGVLQLLNKRGGLFSKDDAGFIEALSVHAAIAIENARLYEQERQKLALEKEIHAARNVQMSLLPQTSPSIPGYEIVGRSISAKVVSGDYFDFIPAGENRTAICVGDVTGKGLPAALLMANLQAILRSQIMLRALPRKTMVRSNKLLYQSTSTEKFVTLFYSILDSKKHLLSYTNAGHEYPIMVRNNGSVELLAIGGTVLGIVDDYAYEDATIAIEPGDTLVMYSDGISEAVNHDEVQFGKEVLERIIQSNRQQSADVLLNRIVESVQSHVGSTPQMDDITIVVVKRTS
jgi:sigma-B regulation protein RsbU (phosphoserine phosphatase)